MGSPQQRGTGKRNGRFPITPVRELIPPLGMDSSVAGEELPLVFTWWSCQVQDRSPPTPSLSGSISHLRICMYLYIPPYFPVVGKEPQGFQSTDLSWGPPTNCWALGRTLQVFELTDVKNQRRWGYVRCFVPELVIAALAPAPLQKLLPKYCFGEVLLN